MRKRVAVPTALLSLVIGPSSALSEEPFLLDLLEGEYFASCLVGFGRGFTINSARMRVTRSSQNTVSFSFAYTIGQASSMSGNVRVQLRYDPKAESYLFDFEAAANSVPRSIQGLALTYSGETGYSGTGMITIAEEKAAVDVSIKIDRAENEHSWSVVVPDEAMVKEGKKAENPREHYYCTFGSGEP